MTSVASSPFSLSPPPPHPPCLTFHRRTPSLVAIPPAGFVSAAHRNGVKALGTVVFDMPDMAETRAFLLGSAGDLTAYATRLVDLAVHYRFDGWMINIETPLCPPAAAGE